MSARGRARTRTTRRTRASLFIPLTLLLVTFTALSVEPASATSVSSLRAQVRAAQAHINQLYALSERRIQAYDAVHARYLKTRRDLHNTRVQLHVARANLKAAQAQLAVTLARSYKSQGQDPLVYVLGAGSFSDLVDQMQLLQRANASDKDLVQEVTHYRAQVRGQVKRLRVQTVNLRRDDRAANRAKQRVLSSLAGAKSYKAHLSARIQNIMDAQAAAAAAAARAAATSSAGSSGGGGNVNLPAPPSSTLGGQAVAIAERYLGVPYVWGGASPSGFDCSGLVMYVYAQLGVSLPHNAAAQYDMLPHVPTSDLEPGDLVFFYGLGHVGIYVGGGTFIHAPHTGTVVQFGSLSSEGPFVAARVP
jgi:peptidoglycan DL-endopeptidase CwlO